MLKSLNSLRGQSLAAIDGPIGTVKDAYFDDHKWVVRYLVVGTGDWLSGRDVLISPNSIGPQISENEMLNVRLTREQVENSPDVNFERPIPRQFEEEYYRYYGWSPYWVGFPLDLYPTAIIPPRPELVDIPIPAKHPAAEDVLSRSEMSHLRSAREIEGYHIHASNGDIGHLEDYLVDAETWRIDYLVADTKNWWPGKKVVVPSRAFDKIDWYNRLARVSLTREQIQAAPEFTPDALDSLEMNYPYHDNAYSEKASR